MEFTILTEKEYQKFLNNYNKKTFLQSVEMGHVNKKTGNIVCYLGIKEKNEVIAASLFIIKENNRRKKKYYYAPRGLLIDYDNAQLLSFFINELKRYIRMNNGYMLKIDPYIELYSRDENGNKTDDVNNICIVEKLNKLGFEYLNYSVQKKWMYVLNIDKKSEEEIFDGFKSTVKNIIRKCQKNGIIIEEINDDFTRFKNIVDETAERKNFQVRDEEYYSLMKQEFKDKLPIYIASLDLTKYIDILNDEMSELIKNHEKIKGDGKRKNNEENINTLKNNINKAKELIVKYGKKIDLAASMFCLYGEEVIYLFSGSKEEFLYLNGPYLIQWHIIQKAIKEKYKTYNFYGIEDLSNPKVTKHGIYDFKKGFNGRVVETIGEMNLYINIIDKLIYKIKKFKKQ